MGDYQTLLYEIDPGNGAVCRITMNRPDKYNAINRENNSVELDIIIAEDINTNKGHGTDALKTLAKHLFQNMNIELCWIEPVARNTRAIRAYEKAGFIRTPATPEQIQAEWGGVDGDDAVLMIRHEKSHNQAVEATS